MGQPDADPADILLGTAEIAGGRGVNILFKGIGVGIFEILQLHRPCQRADDIDIDPILRPFRGGHTAQTPDALLGCGVGALTEVAEQTCAGGKVNYTAFGFNKRNIG